MLDAMPDAMSDVMSDVMSGVMSDAMPDAISDVISDEMSDVMSDDMSDVKFFQAWLSQKPHERKLRNGPRDYDMDVDLPTNLGELSCGDILFESWEWF